MLDCHVDSAVQSSWTCGAKHRQVKKAQLEDTMLQRTEHFFKTKYTICSAPCPL